MTGRRGSGYTLLDLLITLLVLSIVAMIAVPQLASSLAEARLRAAAGRLADALEYASLLAVTYQRPFGVTVYNGWDAFFLFDERYWWSFWPRPNADPPVWYLGIVYHPIEKQPFICDFTQPGPYQGVDMSWGLGPSTIMFYPDGHSSQTGSRINLEFREASCAVLVDGLSGRVSVVDGT